MRQAASQKKKRFFVFWQRVIFGTEIHRDYQAAEWTFLPSLWERQFSIQDLVNQFIEASQEINFMKN